MSVFQTQTASAAATALDPNKHVRFSLGMVLGADDLEQEFAYVANLPQWLARETIGYGTVCGLRVSIDMDARGPRITVDPGVAVTPRGQLVRVSPAQCAYINAWLDSNREEVNRHIGSPVSDRLTLYVILCYRACPTDSVPIPGEPCRDETESMADSRWQDDFELKLAFLPPEQTEEDAVRSFVAWLGQIAITDEPTSFASLSEFLELLRTSTPMLEAPWDSPPISPPGSPLETHHINLADSCDYLRAAFRVWVTELRPRWRGYMHYTVREGDRLATIAAKYNTSEVFLAELNNVSDATLQAGQVLNIPRMFCDGTPPDEQCLLLAELDVPLVGGQADVMSNENIHEERRPYLINLRMLQELLLCSPLVTSRSAADTLGSPIDSPPSSIDDVTETDLTRIVALSWTHGGSTTLDLTLDGNPRKGLIVAFGKNALGDGGLARVEPGSLDHETFQIFAELPGTESGVDFWTYSRLRPDAILPVNATALTGNLVTDVRSVAGPEAGAALLLLSDAAFNYLQNKKLIVVIKGDFVLDGTGRRVIDAEYLRTDLPTGDRPREARSGTQGGCFESWVRVGLVINVNTATAEELQTLPRVGPTLAQSIVDTRTAGGNFLVIEDLLKVPGIGESTLNYIRPFITLT